MIKGGKGGLVNNGILTGIGHTEDALGRSDTFGFSVVRVVGRSKVKIFRVFLDQDRWIYMDDAPTC